MAVHAVVPLIERCRVSLGSSEPTVGFTAHAGFASPPASPLTGHGPDPAPNVDPHALSGETTGTGIRGSVPVNQAVRDAREARETRLVRVRAILTALHTTPCNT